MRQRRPAPVPVPQSVLYGACLACEERDARFLVITFDASANAGGAVLRTLPNEQGV